MLTKECETGEASDFVRDKIMRHKPGSTTFRAYLNSRVKFDVQAAFLERPSQDHLLRAFAHMSLTYDPRAPATVPDEVMRSIPEDSAITKLRARRELLKARLRKKYGTITRARQMRSTLSVKYGQLAAAIASAETKHRRNVLENYRAKYFARCHTQEIERQLNGVTDEYVKPIIQHQLRERTDLEKLLCEFPKNLPAEDIHRRRLAAIRQMTSLCKRRETQRRTHHCRGLPINTPLHSDNLAQAIKEDPFPLVLGRTECVICVGNESMTYKERRFPFCRPSVMMDHVDRHLQQLPAQQRILCRHPVCKSNMVFLEDVIHFKNHVERVHGIRLRA
jgi:Protein of unknown function (DUF3435)